MGESLTSVGLDIGTTTSQMILSRLTVENRASSFAVPEMVIGNREVLYRGQVHLTPLLGKDLVDAKALREILLEEYQQSGISREEVDTGAIIVTGETSRRENARAVLEALSDLAGDFVVATAGPDLESVLAARGSGAVAWSAETGKRVLHMDIGGGTSNLALIEKGEILRTGCMNVGGRLVKCDKEGIITYVSPVVEPLTSLRPGDRAREAALRDLAGLLVRGLEGAAGLREEPELMAHLATREAGSLWQPPGEGCVLSFSGGVADCIREEQPPFAYGDMGPILGTAIRESRLWSGEHRLGEETIRATVIGAGCHSTQLSGSTVYYRNVAFPLKNLPVVHLSEQEQEQDPAAALRKKLEAQEGDAMISIPGFDSGGYNRIHALAKEILRGTEGRPIYLAVAQDMAKALGQILALNSPGERPILCLDRVRPGPGSYLDVGAPVGPALRVVVKTLVLER